jgi:hypothetical protein
LSHWRECAADLLAYFIIPGLEPAYIIIREIPFRVLGRLVCSIRGTRFCWLNIFGGWYRCFLFRHDSSSTAQELRMASGEASAKIVVHPLRPRGVGEHRALIVCSHCSIAVWVESKPNLRTIVSMTKFNFAASDLWYMCADRIHFTILSTRQRSTNLPPRPSGQGFAEYLDRGCLAALHSPRACSKYAVVLDVSDTGMNAFGALWNPHLKSSYCGVFQSV